MKTVFRTLGVSLAGLVAYLCLWPVPISPVVWQAPADPGYVGPYAVNNRLANLQIIDIGKEVGPEHVMIGPDGKLYAAVVSGAILRMQPDGSAQEIFVNTGGRVLGFDFDAAGNLIAADSVQGLLRISPQREIALLTDKVQGDPIRFADAVVVAKSGKIYFSDASQRFGPKDFGGTFNASVLDILEQSATGRILEFDPAQTDKAKATRVVAQGLSFANGIALTLDEKDLFVNETGVYRVWKIATSASNVDLREGSTDQARIVFDNLPGYPDNLMRGLPVTDAAGNTQGKIWLGFAKPRGAAVDKLADKPFLRSLTLRLPRALWPIPKPYGHVMAFTEDGKVVADLQDPAGAYPETTGVTETPDRLYIQSLHANVLGWLKK